MVKGKRTHRPTTHRSTTHRGTHRRNHRRTRGGNMLNKMAVPAGLLVLQRALMAKNPRHSRRKSRKERKGRKSSRR